jgi:type IV pilus assembly protein PilY1
MNVIYFPRTGSNDPIRRAVPRLTMHRWLGLVATVSALSLIAAGGVQAQTAPSQQPLISRDGGGVKPNVMLTMDDSGSMRFQHMPEESAVVGSFTVANPIGSNSVNFDPGDNGLQTVLPAFFVGTVASQPGTTNWRQKFMRSNDTNTIYYSPEIRYLPWIKPDGTRYAPGSVTAARVDPDALLAGTVNLTSVRALNITWCFRDSRSDCSNGNENYSPGLYYRLKKNASGQYLDPQTAGNYDNFDINTGTSFTKHPNRTDCTGTTCTQAEERQNFANWFVYYRSRLLLAKASVGEALYSTEDKFRFGYGRINKGTATTVDGLSTRTVESGVRDYTATRKADLLNWLYAMPSNGGTPLRRAMQDVGNYYSFAGTAGPWSDTPGTATTAAQKTCRRAYHMLVTDGYWNDSIGGSGGTAGLSSVGDQDSTNGSTISGAGGRSYRYLEGRPYRDGVGDRLADYAMNYWKRDLRPDLENKIVPTASDPSFWQSMTNFTVGLGVRGLLNPDTDLPSLTSGTKTWTGDQIDDLWHAAVNSRGEYFSAKDPTELTSAIRSAVGQAVNRELREAGVAAAATILEDGNRKYIPKYQTAAWIGDVDAFALDASGQAGVKIWSAASKLPTWNQRKIYTWDGGLSTPAGTTFTWAAISAANRTALGSAGNANLVDYLRGDRTNESTTGYRIRNGLLGDFVNSNPVFAKGSVNEGYASLPTIGASYPAFLTQKQARPGVLYLGGNGGMLHGFMDTKGVTPADDGKEIFAYVPRAVYPSLSTLATQSYGTTANYHKYFVDGPVREYDAYVPAPGASTSSWRNYLVGTLGAGGKGVFALDVTDPTALNASAIRWELSSADDADLGYNTAPVVVGVLPNGKWVAVFGNGYSEAATSKAYLFVVDLATGVASKLAVDPTVTGNGLGGVAVKKNANGEIVAAYAGDLKGKLWKFNYDVGAASGFVVANTGTALFAAVDGLGNAQAISQTPLLFDHSQGGTLVSFGTGRLLTETDASSTAVQSVYAVWEKPSDSLGPPYNRSQLVTRSVTSSTTTGGATYFDINGSDVNWTTQRGWFIDLSITGYPGLRTIYAPQRVGQTLALFSAVAPALTVVPCDTATGQGVNLLFPIETGKSADYCLFDTNADGDFGAGDNCDVAGYATGADGIDSVLRSPTSTCSGPYCLTRFSIQSTTAGVPIQERTANPPPPGGGGGGGTTQDRIWRRIINPPIR